MQKSHLPFHTRELRGQVTEDTRYKIQSFRLVLLKWYACVCDITVPAKCSLTELVEECET